MKMFPVRSIITATFTAYTKYIFGMILLLVKCGRMPERREIKINMRTGEKKNHNCDLVGDKIKLGRAITYG